MLSSTVAAYCASALRSRSAESSAALSGPSRSTSSSSSGTSDTVHASPSARNSAGSAPAARSRSGDVYSCASRVSGVRIGQSSSSAVVNASLSANSASRFARSCSHAWLSSRVSQPRPIRAIARSVSTYVTISLNTARARLCGSPLARASWTAHSAVSASIRIVTSASSIGSGCSGTRCRSAIAAASTSRILREPLSRAASGMSSPVARRPGTRSPVVMNTTSVSPREGSTRPMWFRNAGLGPTTSTPWFSIRLRWV